jgi:hypothetical protein
MRNPYSVSGTIDCADGRVFLAPSCVCDARNSARLNIDNGTVGNSFKLPIRRLRGRRKDGGKDRHY